MAVRTPHLDLFLQGWTIGSIAALRGIDAREIAARIGVEVDRVAKDMGGRFRA